MERCGWVGVDTIYQKYHDTEWGVPEYDSRTLWEKLILDGFQAGLSWITILKKRDNFRKAFDNFEYEIVAKYDESKVESLMNDVGIIRNKLKINAALSNAKAFIEVQNEFGSFEKYIWGFVDGKPIQNQCKTIGDIPPKTLLSDKLSKDLKKRGFKFVGSTIVYAYMQATGMVNDHATDCFRYKEVAKLG